MALPGPGGGLPPARPPLVGHLAQGRGAERATASRCSGSSCRTACRPRPCYATRPGPLGRGARLAVAAHHARSATCSIAPASRPRPGPRSRSRSGRRRRVGLHAGRWCPYGLTPDLAARPAARGRRLPHLRHRSAARAARDPGRRPSPSSSWRSTGRWRSSPRVSPTSPPTAPPRASATASSTSPTGRATSTRRALEPGRRYRVRLPAQRRRASLPGRPPHPPRALDGLLAHRLAGARASHAHALRRRERPHAARAPPGPGRRDARRRCRRSRPRRRSRSRSTSRRAPSASSTTT